MVTRWQQRAASRSKAPRQPRARPLWQDLRKDTRGEGLSQGAEAPTDSGVSGVWAAPGAGETQFSSLLSFRVCRPQSFSSFVVVGPHSDGFGV